MTNYKDFNLLSIVNAIYYRDGRAHSYNIHTQAGELLHFTHDKGIFVVRFFDVTSGRPTEVCILPFTWKMATQFVNNHKYHQIFKATDNTFTIISKTDGSIAFEVQTVTKIFSAILEPPDCGFFLDILNIWLGKFPEMFIPNGFTGFGVKLAVLYYRNQQTSPYIILEDLYLIEVSKLFFFNNQFSKAFDIIDRAYAQFEENTIVQELHDVFYLFSDQPKSEFKITSELIKKKQDFTEVRQALIQHDWVKVSLEFEQFLNKDLHHLDLIPIFIKILSLNEAPIADYWIEKGRIWLPESIELLDAIVEHYYSQKRLTELLNLNLTPDWFLSKKLDIKQIPLKNNINFRLLIARIVATKNFRLISSYPPILEDFRGYDVAQPVLSELFKLAQHAGDVALVKTLYKKLSEQAQFVADELAPDLDVEIGYTLYYSEQNEEALSVCDTVLQRSPKSEDAIKLKSVILASEGNVSGSLTNLAVLDSNKKKYSTAILQVAKYFFSIGEFGLSLVFFNAALSAEMSNYALLFTLSFLQLVQKNFTESVFLFNKAIQIMRREHNQKKAKGAAENTITDQIDKLKQKYLSLLSCSLDNIEKEKMYPKHLIAINFSSEPVIGMLDKTNINELANLGIISKINEISIGLNQNNKSIVIHPLEEIISLIPKYSNLPFEAQESLLLAEQLMRGVLSVNSYSFPVFSYGRALEITLREVFQHFKYYLEYESDLRDLDLSALDCPGDPKLVEFLNDGYFEFGKMIHSLINCVNPQNKRDPILSALYKFFVYINEYSELMTKVNLSKLSDLALVRNDATHEGTITNTVALEIRQQAFYFINILAKTPKITQT